MRPYSLCMMLYKVCLKGWYVNPSLVDGHISLCYETIDTTTGQAETSIWHERGERCCSVMQLVNMHSIKNSASR